VRKSRATGTPSKTQPKPKANAADTILIRKVAIPVERRELPNRDLRFYVDNPRVHSVLRSGDKVPSQEEILEHLTATDHVKSLYHDIQRDGGLTDPVIVRARTLEVLEGNSRLAAYRLLSEKDPEQWNLMRCVVLPADIPEELVFALLGQYHVKGKLAWVPFEQAGFLYRRYKLHHNDLETVAREIGLKGGKAEHMVATYTFMQHHGDSEVTHWSYYDEFLKSREIKKARLRHPELDDVFVSDVVQNDNVSAIEVRTKLAKLCKHDRILRKFVSRDATLHDAFRMLVDSGAEAKAFQKLQRFNRWFSSDAAAKEIRQCTGAERQRVILELRKLAARMSKMKQTIDGAPSKRK
jgi:hypothetical protein